MALVLRWLGPPARTQPAGVSDDVGPLAIQLDEVYAYIQLAPIGGLYAQPFADEYALPILGIDDDVGLTYSIASVRISYPSFFGDEDLAPQIYAVEDQQWSFPLVLAPITGVQPPIDDEILPLTGKQIDEDPGQALSLPNIRFGYPLNFGDDDFVPPPGGIDELYWFAPALAFPVVYAQPLVDEYALPLTATQIDEDAQAWFSQSPAFAPLRLTFGDDDFSQAPPSIVDEDAQAPVSLQPIWTFVRIWFGEDDYVQPPASMVDEIHWIWPSIAPSFVGAQPFSDEYVLPLTGIALDEDFATALSAAPATVTYAVFFGEEFVPPIAYCIDDDLNATALQVTIASRWTLQPGCLQEEIGLHASIVDFEIDFYSIPRIAFAGPFIQPMASEEAWSPGIIPTGEVIVIRLYHEGGITVINHDRRPEVIAGQPSTTMLFGKTPRTEV
jgi:hypothetical protein